VPPSKPPDDADDDDDEATRAARGAYAEFAEEFHRCYEAAWGFVAETSEWVILQHLLADGAEHAGAERVFSTGVDRLSYEFTYEPGDEEELDAHEGLDAHEELDALLARWRRRGLVVTYPPEREGELRLRIDLPALRAVLEPPARAIEGAIEDFGRAIDGE
jgi:hypothetical protein